MDPSRGGLEDVEAAAEEELDTVLFKAKVGDGKTEVEHLRHSVIVINSAVTTDESQKGSEEVETHVKECNDLQS